MVIDQNFIECGALIVLKLIRRTQAQPPDVDAFDARSSTAPAAARLRWWTRSTPRLEGLHQRRVTALVPLSIQFALELCDLRAVGLPATLQILAIWLQRGRAWPFGRGCAGGRLRGTPGAARYCRTLRRCMPISRAMRWML